MLGQELLKIFPDAIGIDRPSLKLRTTSAKDLDITNKAQVENKIKELQPDIIINCAAYNAVDKCENPKEFELAKKINGDAVGYLADACLKNNIILIHFSTNYVFDGNSKDGYNEDNKPNPISKYGQTKLMGEQEILKRDNLKYYLIRLSKLFGKKGSSEVAKDNFFDVMMSAYAKASTDKKIKVVDDELSNFTYAPDLAQVVQNLIEQNYKYGIYHIVNEDPCTWYDGAKTLFDILNRDVKLIRVDSKEFPRPAARPQYGILLNTKFPKLRSYKEALKEYLSK